MKKIILLWFICLAQTNLFSSAPVKQRILSIAPATTEILFALGLDEEIIGVTTFCNYPAQASSKPKIGTFSQPSIETIVTLKPEIIFATGLEQATSVEKLKKLKFKVYVSDPSNLQELFVSIKEMGKLTNRDKEAENLVGQMKSKIEKVKSNVAGIPKDKRMNVFLEIWHDPLMTAGKGSFVDELIQLAGGINIAYDTPRPYSYFSAEQVIKRDPDCIILGYMNAKPEKSARNRLGWKNIKAVKNGRVYSDINPDIMLRPGPRLADGLEEIYKKLYPK